MTSVQHSEGVLTLADDTMHVELDPSRGALTTIRVAGRDFVEADRAISLLRAAVPLPDYAAHWLDLTSATPLVEVEGQAVTLNYTRLNSEDLSLPVTLRLRVGLDDRGLVVSAQLTNDSEHLIPQVTFPQLGGLVPAEPGGEVALQLPGRRMEPLAELTMRPDDEFFLELALQTYVYYGSLDMTMKWFDFGDAETGLSVYSTDTRYTTQGLHIARQARDRDHLDLRWAHYPELAGGETWDSGEFVLFGHTGDWYVGVRRYQEFARDHYRYDAPAHVREALAIRSIWPALRNTPPTFKFTDIPDYVEEVADPELGVGEVVLWHWWLKNGLPMIVDERLGTEAELVDALAWSRERGVPISMFVSHHILRESEESDPDWKHRNRAQQARVWNWTYSDDYIPRFDVLYDATHSMVKASGLSKGWRETSLEEYRRIMDMGAESICFDVFYAWDEPNYSPAADGRPDEEGERLVEFGLAAKEIIRSVRPQGSFSGEWPSDTKVGVIDYTWDWRMAFEMNETAPFRYVFPEFRLNANVGAHPRGPAVAFMEDALLNVMPGSLRTERLSEHPQLLDQLRELNRLRRRFLPFFTHGQFHHLEGTEVTGGQARTFRHGNEFLIIACNPTEETSTVTVALDTALLLDRSGISERPEAYTVTGHSQDGTENDLGVSPPAVRVQVELEADKVAVIHLCAEAADS
ncbi:hypothetical protein K8W59_08300 [Nocardioides rotundus]|uniref:hypothetical protein n=1 Tax=Nocardioides rotundus TaxID=1774216 RepID=UPI001CBE12E5|nr:hypothetical protein [Nocardioides rotundus]UAL31428.1 hypothetical protein K8W59_08300 [Nocardioides rotundus]